MADFDQYPYATHILGSVNELYMNQHRLWENVLGLGVYCFDPSSDVGTVYQEGYSLVAFLRGKGAKLTHLTHQ